MSRDIETFSKIQDGLYIHWRINHESKTITVDQAYVKFEDEAKKAIGVGKNWSKGESARILYEVVYPHAESIVKKEMQGFTGYEYKLTKSRALYKAKIFKGTYRYRLGPIKAFQITGKIYKEILRPWNQWSARDHKGDDPIKHTYLKGFPKWLVDAFSVSYGETGSVFVHGAFDFEKSTNGGSEWVLRVTTDTETEDWHVVYPNDWIINAGGRLYPMKDSTFKLTYEQVEDE